VPQDTKDVRVTNSGLHTDNGSKTTVASLVLAVFTVSLAYGTMLPLLPDLVERLFAVDGSAPSQVARQTGLLSIGAMPRAFPRPGPQ